MTDDTNDISPFVPPKTDDGKRYKVIRFRFSGKNTTIARGLTLTQARAFCTGPNTSGKHWFNGYAEE